MESTSPQATVPDKLLATLEMIIIDSEEDVARYEHAPFDGRTMAAYQAEQNAMIQAVAMTLRDWIIWSRL